MSNKHAARSCAHRWGLLCGSVLLSGSTLLGCSDKDTEVSTGEARATGTLQMALTAELEGESYGLRADVAITGPEALVLQATPEARVLETELIPGDYSVALEPGFQLFLLVPDEEPVPVEAELLSPISRDVTIQSNTTTSVEFRFAVPELAEPELAEPEPEPGSLRVGIDVERAVADAGAPPEPVALGFELDVWPIFQASCGPCHTGLGRGGHNVGSVTLAEADADARRLGATIIQRLDGGGMPPACTGVPGDPGCISVENLATIQAWLDTGLAP